MFNSKLNISKKDILAYLIIFFSICITYCVYLPMHYGTDSYIVVESFKAMDAAYPSSFDAVKSEAYMFLSNGRFARMLIFLTFALIGKASVLNLPWVNYVAVFFMCLSGCTVCSIIKKHSKSKNAILFLALLLSLCNPFFTDWMQFIECQIFYPFGLFLAIYAVKITFSQGFSVKNWIIAFVLLAFSAGIYQITMQWFVIGTVVVILLELRKNHAASLLDAIKHIFFNAFYAISIFCAAAGFQLFITKILFTSTRTEHAFSLTNALSQTFNACMDMFHMVPYTNNKGAILFPISCIILLTLCIVSLKKRHSNLIVTLFYISFTILCILGVIASISLPLWMSELWFAQRSTVGFWGIILVLAAATDWDTLSSKSKHTDILYALTVCCLCVLFVINVATCIEFGVDLHRTNGIDMMRANMIQNEINKYEETNASPIEQLAFHFDANATWAYDNVSCYKENNLSAWCAVWNHLPMMNSISDTVYVQVPFPEDLYAEKFAEKNWDTFSHEQIFFDGNTAYIVLY